MSAAKDNAGAATLDWPGKVLTADDLRRQLRGQRQVRVAPRTLVTPLALDELRDRGVTLIRDDSEPRQSRKAASWIAALEREEPSVRAALAATARDGISVAASMVDSANRPAWYRSLGLAIREKQSTGCLVFCASAAEVVCAANRVAGLRAAAVATATQAKKALARIGANMLAVEMPGPTFFEVRQIVKTAAATTPACPDDVAKVLQELDGHAHR
jgi:ribose 5-phosphate isomerase RpiB